MKAINIRLHELEELETALFAERRDTLKRRFEEDQAFKDLREQEDREWKQRIETHDREEDVSRSSRMKSLSIH